MHFRTFVLRNTHLVYKNEWRYWDNLEESSASDARRVAGLYPHDSVDKAILRGLMSEHIGDASVGLP